MTKFNSTRPLSPFLSALLLLAILLPVIAEAASVSSISREQYRQDSPEDIFWEVAVSCSGIRDKRIIQQRADTREWCAKEVAGLCSKDKMKAAQRVCGPAFKREQTAARKAPAPAPKPTPTPTSTQTPVPAPQPVASTPVAEPERAVAPRITITPPTTSPTSPQPNQAETAEPTNAGDSEAIKLLKSEIEIETQRISIEQEKLDLRRRELELKKRELGLLEPQAN